MTVIIKLKQASKWLVLTDSDMLYEHLSPIHYANQGFRAILNSNNET